VHDVDDLLGPVALQQAGGDGGALADPHTTASGLLGSTPSGTSQMSW